MIKSGLKRIEKESDVALLYRIFALVMGRSWQQAPGDESDSMGAAVKRYGKEGIWSTRLEKKDTGML